MKDLVIVTDGEPDDLWSIYMLLKSKLKFGVIGIIITSPRPNYHFEAIDELIKASPKNYERISIYNGTLYGRGIEWKQHVIVGDTISKVIKEIKSFDLLLLTNAFDICDLIKKDNIEVCFEMGGKGKKGGDSFNWRINKEATTKFQKLMKDHGGHKLFHSKYYCENFSSSMNKGNAPLFYKYILSVKDNKAIDLLMKEASKFNKKIPEKYKKDGWETQLCPADIWVTFCYIISYDKGGNKNVTYKGKDVDSFDWKYFDKRLTEMIKQ